MFKKLTLLGISAILTAGLVAASAPEVTTQKQIELKVDAFVDACRQGYIDYRYAKKRMPGTENYTVPSAKEAMDVVLAKFPKDQHGVVALICLGYGEGYEDGVKGTS